MPSAVIGGNERVVRPRLADAKFFFDQDRKKTLASRVAGLAKVVYHNKLGTQGERMERVRAHRQGDRRAAGRRPRWRSRPTGRAAGQGRPADRHGRRVPRAAGHHGPLLRAATTGWATTIADAIEDHYKPRFAGDELPRNQVGVVVALADKLETLAGLFAIGQLPTGDKDPFALRRHALGIVRMLMEKDLPLALDELAGPRPWRCSRRPSAETGGQLSDFIYDRLAGSLREQGYSAQEVDAVLALRPQRLGDVAKRLAAVRAFAALPEAPALAAANKRIGNILKKAEKADAACERGRCSRKTAEKALYAGDADSRARRPARSSRPATTPARCRRWPRCAARSTPSSTA